MKHIIIYNRNIIAKYRTKLSKDEETIYVPRDISKLKYTVELCTRVEMCVTLYLQKSKKHKLFTGVI